MLRQGFCRALHQSRDSERRAHETLPDERRAPDLAGNRKRGSQSLRLAPVRQSLDKCECENLRACARSRAGAVESSAAETLAVPGLRASKRRAPQPGRVAALRAE